MAKAVLKISNPELSKKTGLHRNTLNKVDAGEGSASTLNLLRLVFEAEGISFIEEFDTATGPGVCYQPS